MQDTTVPSDRDLGVGVKETTSHPCACRCGIRVRGPAGQVGYIEGNPDHPLNDMNRGLPGEANLLHDKGLP
jgi:anaerobic selenocysteine-containing dehydrogenase